MSQQMPIYPSYMAQGMHYIPTLPPYCLTMGGLPSEMQQPLLQTSVYPGGGTVYQGGSAVCPTYSSSIMSGTPTPSIISGTPARLSATPPEDQENVASMARVSPMLGSGDTVSVAQLEEKEEYMGQLYKEKERFQQSEIGRGQTRDTSHIIRILDREISMLQAGYTGSALDPDPRLLDVYREKPVRLTLRVAVPVKEHPKFNFVGKLLGPKGNSLKRLQEETLTKMAVLGKGSMRDKAREEDMRLSKDPKHLHLSEDLHVEITAFAPPAEAHARLSYALTEIRKYLIPDSNDHIRQLQMKELEILSNSDKIISSSTLATAPSMQTMQPLLLTSPSYLQPSQMSLLPTPPLDLPQSLSAPLSHPTITAPPTNYVKTEDGIPTLPSDSHTLKISLKEEQSRLRRKKTGPY